MSELVTQLDLEGPFFQNDPAETLWQNLHRMMQGVAEEGAEIARNKMRAGEGGRALIRRLDDRVADHVIGRTTALRGKQWGAWAVVQVLNEGFTRDEGISLMAAASVVERRTKAIGTVKRQAFRLRAVVRANLAEGMG